MLILWGSPLWPVVMIVQGILLVFLFTLLHETSHRTPFEQRWINDAVGHVCGFILFLPANWFRCFHFAHHKFTQAPGKDPELGSLKPETVAQYLWHVSGVPVWIGHARTVVENALGRASAEYVPERRRGPILWGMGCCLG